jgi:hypothetical protein
VKSPNGFRSRITLPAAARLVLAAALLAVLASACAGGNGDGAGAGAGTDESSEPPATGTVAKPSRFSAEVDHPLVPLSSVPVTIFEGRESGRELRVESKVLEKTEFVAGVRVAVVKVREYVDGKLVEETLDYYAESKDGSVWYFGERVDDYKDGKVVGHSGQWFAGQGDAKAGLFMPARPKVGQAFEQERAPGVAEDRSKVVALGVDVTTPAGRFSNCIKTEDFAPLDNVTEFKYYCPGVGLVREEGPGAELELVRYS